MGLTLYTIADILFPFKIDKSFLFFERGFCIDHYFEK